MHGLHRPIRNRCHAYATQILKGLHACRPNVIHYTKKQSIRVDRVRAEGSALDSRMTITLVPSATPHSRDVSINRDPSSLVKNPEAQPETLPPQIGMMGNTEAAF